MRFHHRRHRHHGRSGWSGGGFVFMLFPALVGGMFGLLFSAISSFFAIGVCVYIWIITEIWAFLAIAITFGAVLIVNIVIAILKKAGVIKPKEADADGSVTRDGSTTFVDSTPYAAYGNNTNNNDVFGEATFSATIANCPGCGAENGAGDTFCSKCGRRIR